MPVQIKTDEFLIDGYLMTPEIYRECAEIMYTLKDSTHAFEFLKAIQQHSELVMVAKDNFHNQVYCILYVGTKDPVVPGGAVKIHSFMIDKAIRCRKAQLRVLKQYVEYLFVQEFYKIICEVPEHRRLNCQFIRRAGFTEEGRHRKEYTDASGTYDMIYYGLLREEYYGT